MVQCGKCKADNRDSAKYCTSCGTSITSIPKSSTCKTCSNELTPGAKFCKICGANTSPPDNHEPMEGLCVLVCDVSGSMEDIAFPPEPNTKMSMVTNAIDGAIVELSTITKAGNAYIAIVTFGETAAFLKDRYGDPFIKSIRQITAEFPRPGDLECYLDDSIAVDLAGAGRKQTNITAGLTLARDIFDAATGPARSLARFGYNGPIEIMSQELFSAEGVMIAIPNVRVMAYSDGAHNPGDGSSLTNPFSALSPSPLMTAFIGDESQDDNRRGADQMNQIATKCPSHGHSGYFLINSSSRQARLRNIFKMASGISGFCPQCLHGRNAESRMRVKEE